MLKSAFDVAMHARIRNLGIYKSIGATDAQVRRLLLAEGCAVICELGRHGDEVERSVPIGMDEEMCIRDSSNTIILFEL